MTLGARIFKTGLSVTLALYICLLLQLETAVFAGVAAVLTIQPSIYRTWKHVLDQFITNTLGALIALFVIYFWGNDPITIGIVVILVILISLKLKMESTISLTLVTVLAIMSAPGNEDWYFAVNRFLSIIIGIICGFTINVLVMPPKYKKNYLNKVHSTFQSLSLLLRTAISNELTEKSFQEQEEKLKSEINKLEEMYKIFDEERAKMSKLNPLDTREIVVFKQMLKTLQQGEELLEVIGEHFFQSKTNSEEKDKFDQQLEYLIKCHEHFLLKYEGKIKVEEQSLYDLVKDNSLFLEEIMEKYGVDQDQRLRLVVIGSSIFEYAFQLHRLNNLVDRYLKTLKT